MRGLDLIFAPIALVSFALSMAVIFIWVPEPALAVVCSFGVLLCAYDFWQSAFRNPRPRNDVARPLD